MSLRISCCWKLSAVSCRISRVSSVELSADVPTLICRNKPAQDGCATIAHSGCWEILKQTWLMIRNMREAVVQDES